MNGLIAGALKGLGEGAAFLGKTGIAANLEREKAAAEEARQVRLEEMKNTAAEKRLNAELAGRSSMLDREITARREISTEELAARKELNAADNAARRELAEMQERGANNRAALAAGKNEPLRMLQEKYLASTDPEEQKRLAVQIRALSGKLGESPELKVIAEDPVTGAKKYGAFVDGKMVEVPVAGASPTQLNGKDGRLPSPEALKGYDLNPAPKEKPTSSQDAGGKGEGLISKNRTPDGANAADRAAAFKQGINNGLASIQQQIKAVTNDRTLSEPQRQSKLLELTSQYSDLQSRLK